MKATPFSLPGIFPEGITVPEIRQKDKTSIRRMEKRNVNQTLCFMLALGDGCPVGSNAISGCEKEKDCSPITTPCSL